MSRLVDLIAELCPEGVSYRKIGEIAEVGTGSSNGNEAIEDGVYPFFVRSQTIKAKNDFEYDEEAIIIPGEGGIGEIFHYINGKYALHQRVYRIHFATDDVNVKFAYYYMQAHFKTFIMKKALSLILALIMAFSLVACGGEKGNSDTPAPDSSPRLSSLTSVQSIANMYCPPPTDPALKTRDFMVIPLDGLLFTLTQH